MLHLLSASLGVLFVALSLAGLFTTVGATWLVWVVGAAGLILVGAGAIDRREASHVKRAQALVLIAIALAGALLIGASTVTATWFFAAVAVGTACAFVAGLAALAKP